MSQQQSFQCNNPFSFSISTSDSNKNNIGSEDKNKSKGHQIFTNSQVQNHTSNQNVYPINNIENNTYRPQFVNSLPQLQYPQFVNTQPYYPSIQPQCVNFPTPYPNQSNLYDQLIKSRENETKLKNKIDELENIIKKQYQLILQYQTSFFEFQRANQYIQPQVVQAQVFQPQPQLIQSQPQGQPQVVQQVEEKTQNISTPVVKNKKKIQRQIFESRNDSETDTDNEIVKRIRTIKPIENVLPLQKILVDIHTENEDMEFQRSLLAPTKEDFLNSSFSTIQRVFLNKKPAIVDFTIPAENELIDRISFINVNGHRFLKVNNDFKDTNIVNFINNKVDIPEELKIIDGLDLVEVKSSNRKWMQGLTYTGMTKILFYLANNFPNLYDKFTSKFSSSLNIITFSCKIN